MLFQFLRNFYENLKGYFKNISIHGLCSIFRSKNWLQVIFWTIIFLFGVQYFCGLLYENLIEFNNQPVTKTIDTTTYPISTVPFPAVTVCNFNAVYKPLSKPIEKLLLDKGIKAEVIKSFFRHLALLRTPMPIDVSPYEEIYQVLKENGYKDNTEFLRNLSQPCNQILKFCSWAGTELNCNQIFKPAKGDFGFCCSFNSILDPVDENSKKDYFTSAGPLYGLVLHFNIDLEEYVAPLYNSTGILVMVHDRNSYANSDIVFFSVVEQGTEIAMKLAPDIFEAESQLDQLKATARGCWLDGEGTRFLNVKYSFENCMHICKSKAIINVCNCYPHYHRDHVNLRSCNLLDMSCLIKYYDNFTALRIKSRVEIDPQKNEVICDCLPPCSGIDYLGSIEAIYFTDKDGKRNNNLSAVRIFFQNNFCKKYIIYRTVTWESFIALVGGFFALCLGGSIVSVIELLYYFFKSIFTKSSYSNTIVPQLYWSELEIYNKNKIEKFKNKSVIILK